MPRPSRSLHDASHTLLVLHRPSSSSRYLFVDERKAKAMTLKASARDNGRHISPAEGGHDVLLRRSQDKGATILRESSGIARPVRYDACERSLVFDLGGATWTAELLDRGGVDVSCEGEDGRVVAERSHAVSDGFSEMFNVWIRGRTLFVPLAFQLVVESLEAVRLIEAPSLARVA